MGRIELWAHPGARRDDVAWDPFRSRWIVSCREPAVDGRANVAIARLLALRLGVPPRSVRYLAGVRSRAKVVEVEGLAEAEIRVRLERGHAGSRP